MENTNVYIMVPQYSGVDGAIQSAYDLVVSVNSDGPIKFHLVDYPEENPQGKMTFDKDWTGKKEPEPEREGFEPNAPICSKSVIYKNSFR